MPLYKNITIDERTKVLIWKIEESLAFLSESIKLTPHCQKRLDSMKSEIHQRGFMSIRHLLALEGYEDCDLYYDEFGKPHLKDGKYISITHSFTFTGIIISDRPVGIDIEKQREKILRIAHKFTPIQEYHTMANDEAKIRKLTIVWGIKESVYKVLSIPGLRFLEHIYVEDFDFDTGSTTARVSHLAQSAFEAAFLEFEGFTCAYILPSI